MPTGNADFVNAIHWLGHGNRRVVRLLHPAGGGPAASYADGDTPEFVAEIILQAIREGQAQYFANDRLRQMAGVSG